VSDGSPSPGTGAAPPLEPVPWRWVGLIAAATTALLLLVARRYGWHRDELYFLEAGRHHLAWGYVDQPPFTPLLARLADWVAPGNLVVLRTPPAVAAGVTVVLGALVARELGGDRRAQVAAAAALACCGFPLGVGHLLSTAAFDLTAWMALLWLTARLLRTDEPRWWLAFGAVAGLALWNKHLPVLLAITVVAGLAAAGRWRVLRTWWLPAGGALALLLVLPNLLWQADHGWPQLDMAEALSERLAGENRATLLPLQLLFAGPLLVVVLWAGARALATDERLRAHRALLWMWPIGLAITFATAGRPYYVLPLTVVVLLAGVVAWVRRGRTRLLTAMLVASTVTAVPLALPVLPTSAVEVTGVANEAAAETIGWPELVDQVATVVGGLPTADREHVVLLTLTYGEAGAIDRFGPARGLPPAHSGHNGYADFRQPSDPDAVVVAVRYRPEALRPWFDTCERVGRVDNGLDVDNEVQGTPIVVCRGLQRPWPEVWDDLRRLS
jgi:4-amino-4-deoxy-L-arabinose transferase-like glycosyltransferase